MLNIDGLVIAQKDVGESSRVITLLTSELGCIEVYVRGGQKSKKASGSTQLFCHCSFCLQQKRDAYSNMNYYYDSCEPKNMFYSIRLDAGRLALACYFSELLLFAAQSPDETGEVLRLTLNTLYFLNKGDRNEELLKCIFEFRLLCETGFRPNLIGCCHCYKTEDDAMHFNLKSGLIECDDCVTNRDSAFDITFDRTLFYIVRYIALVDYDKLFNFKISDKYLKKLESFTEKFVEYYYGKRFETLKFYRMIK
ncbi:MAG: DNA repair protein RecO [Ruminococcus sp.]|nr:DNA repair protein RecO [Ruminococcus sp.]